MRQLRWLGLAVAALAAAGLAGCGADSGGGFATPTFQKAGPPANRGGPVTLTMDNIAFMPAQATQLPASMPLLGTNCTGTRLLASILSIARSCLS